MNWTKKVKDKLDELRDDDGYYVYEVMPSRRTQEKYQFSSSTSAGLVDQISLFNAFAEYNRTSLLAPNWKRFEDNFIDCFPAAVDKSLNFGTAQTPWGRNKSDRPKFKILYPTDPEAVTDETNRVIWLIEFWPNRSILEESYLLYGYLNDVIIQTIQIMQISGLTANLNHVLGLPITEHLKIAPKVGLTLQINFSNYKDPPWYKSAQRPDYIKHQVSIPFLKRSAANSYQTIRNACGGSNGINWGRERATAYVALSTDQYPANKKGCPQVWCGGGSEAQAKSNIKQLLQLSESIIISFNKSGKDYREGTEAKRLQEEIPSQSYKVYPNVAWIENTRIVEAGTPRNSTPARKILMGKLNKKTNRFRLDFTSEPLGFTQAMNELLTWEN